MTVVARTFQKIILLCPSLLDRPIRLPMQGQLLELTRLLAAYPEKLQRSILILFTTGEEKGLLGSTYYTDHPIVPLYRTSANINIDGLALFDEFNNVVGVGSDLSTLGEELTIVARQNNLVLTEIPSQYFVQSQSMSRSDQFSFAKAGITGHIVTQDVADEIGDAGIEHLAPGGRLRRI